MKSSRFKSAGKKAKRSGKARCKDLDRRWKSKGDNMKLIGICTCWKSRGKRKFNYTTRRLKGRLKEDLHSRAWNSNSWNTINRKAHMNLHRNLFGTSSAIQKSRTSMKAINDFSRTDKNAKITMSCQITLSFSRSLLRKFWRVAVSNWAKLWDRKAPLWLNYNLRYVNCNKKKKR